MNVLVIDASGASAEVAVFTDGACLGHGSVAMRSRDRETLLPLVLDVLATARLAVSTLQRVVVGDGPGAFTSLRIATATAKGLVHGTSVELAACSSLTLLAASAGNAPDGTRRLVLTDALRGERFAQPVERLASGWAELAPATIVSADASRDAAQRWSAAVLDTVSAPLEIDARAWVTLAPYATRGVSLATWEPHYGRLAEAQVKWEATAGHALSVPAPVVDVGGGP